MPDLKKYWQEVRAIEKTLPEFVWLTSLDNPKRGQAGGCLTEASASVAAKLLHAKSHRVATEEEVAVDQQHRAAVAKSLFHEKLPRQGVAVVTVDAI